MVGPPDHGELLARGRDQVERFDLLVPEREVVGVGHDHQDRRVEKAWQVRKDAVLEQELDRLDRVAVLVPRRFARLELVEDRVHLGERPGADGLPVIGRGHRHVRARLTRGTVLAIGFDRRQQRTKAVASVDASHVLVAVHHSNDRDRRSDARIERRDDQRVTAAVGDPPRGDPGLVDPGLCGDERDRASIVLDLIPRVDVLARLAVARAQTPVIEHQRRAAHVVEAPRVVRLPKLLDVAPAPGHDHDRERALAFRQVEVASDRVAPAAELRVLHHTGAPSWATAQ